MKTLRLWVWIFLCLFLSQCFGGSSSGTDSGSEINSGETNIQETGGPVSAPFPIAKGQDGMNLQKLSITIGNPQDSNFDHSVTFVGEAGAVIDSEINDLRAFRESDQEEFEFLNVVDSDGSFPTAGEEPIRVDSDSNDQVFLGPQAENGDVSYGVIVQPMANGDHIIAVTNTSLLTSDTLHLDVNGNLYIVANTGSSGSSLVTQTTESTSSTVFLMNGTEVSKTIHLPDHPKVMTSVYYETTNTTYFYYVTRDGNFREVQIENEDEFTAEPETISTFDSAEGISFEVSPSTFNNEELDQLYIHHPAIDNLEGTLYNVQTDGLSEIHNLFGRGDHSIQSFVHGMSYRYIQDDTKNGCEVTDSTFGCITTTSAGSLEVGEECNLGDCAVSDDPNDFSPDITDLTREITQLWTIKGNNNFAYFLSSEGQMFGLYFTHSLFISDATELEEAGHIGQVGDDSIEIGSFTIAEFDDKNIIVACTTDDKIAVLFKNTSDDIDGLKNEMAASSWKQYDVACEHNGTFSVDEDYYINTFSRIGSSDESQVVKAPVFSKSILEDLGANANDEGLENYIEFMKTF